MSRSVVLALAAGCLALALAPAGASRQNLIRFHATFTAPTHTPRVGEAWTYAVFVRDLAGHRIGGVVVPQVIYRRHRIDTVGWLKFRHGVFRRVYRWPAVDLGRELVFRVTVIAKGGSKRLEYRVRVR
jgi:hypothetical protein